MKQSKQRHYCTHCGRKQYAHKMVRIRYNLLHQTAWHCNSCLSANADTVFTRHADVIPYMIELFSGSKTISKQAESMGFEAFTIDIEPKFSPDLVADVLTLKATDIPGKGRCLLFWASVPCTWFTILTIGRHWHKKAYAYRKYQYLPKTDEAARAIRILEKTLHLIEVINPVYFILENPRGAMRHMPQVKGIPHRYTVSYSDYGAGVYKLTDLFTNIPYLKLHKLKGAMGRRFTDSVADQKDAFTRSIVPAELVNSILSQIMDYHGMAR